jgi:hypothetical protein
MIYLRLKAATVVKIWPLSGFWRRAVWYMVIEDSEEYLSFIRNSEFYSENRGDLFVRNTSDHQQDNKVSQPRWLKSTLFPNTYDTVGRLS